MIKNLFIPILLDPRVSNEHYFKGIDLGKQIRKES